MNNAKDISLNITLFIRKYFLELILAFIPPVLVFMTDFMLDILYDIYLHYPWVDIPMHFAGGIAIAFTCCRILSLLRVENLAPTLSIWWKRYVLMSSVLFIAIMWEFQEFTWDYIFKTEKQTGLADTMLDLLLGLIGGGLMIMIYTASNREKEKVF